MSLSLIINKAGEENVQRYIPFLTEELFYKKCFPMLEQGNYFWLSQLPVGFSFTEKELDAICEEIIRLQSKFNEPLMESKEYNHILKRLNTILEELALLKEKSFAAFWG